jgi:hypothetical protein
VKIIFFIFAGSYTWIKISKIQGKEILHFLLM